jgi:hypothetical protein
MDELLAEGTRILAAEDVPRIRAATDVLIDQIEQAADQCSGGGLIKPSRVVAVGRLPPS